MSKYIDKETVRRIIDSERSKEQMLTMLDNVPTADVRENKHGEWLEAVSGNKTIKRYRCSRCNYHVLFNRENFCPWCGASMMKGEKDGFNS